MYLNYVCSQIKCNDDCCISCMCIHVHDYHVIRWTLNSSPGPLQSHTLHISWYYTCITRRWTDLRNTSLYSNKVPLTKINLRAPLVALKNINSHAMPTFVAWKHSCLSSLGTFHQEGLVHRSGRNFIHVLSILVTKINICIINLVVIGFQMFLLIIVIKMEWLWNLLDSFVICFS